MGWLRNLVRKKTKPIDPEYALRMKKLLSGLYFFAAWNAFAYAIYSLMKERNPKTLDEQENPSKYYHRLLGAGEAKVIKFRGFIKTHEYMIEAVDKSTQGRTKEEEGHAVETLEEKAHYEDLGLLVEETNSL